MDARRLPAAHGILWLAGGFALFRRNPPLMTSLTLGYFLVMIVINLIPVVGPFIVPLALPALTVMLGNGCRSVAAGQPMSWQVITEGMQAQGTGLLRLGGLHLIGSSLLVLASLALGDTIDLNDGLSHDEAAELLSDMGILMVLASPILMAFWFAPLLTAWDGVSAMKSVFFSFVASWRNLRAFAMYGLALSVIGILVPGLILVVAGQISASLLGILSAVLRMMLIFVLAPTLVASVYLSYRDVFAPPPPPATNIDEIV